MRMPATISPTTAGTPMRSDSSAATLAATRTIRMWRRISAMSMGSGRGQEGSGRAPGGHGRAVPARWQWLAERCCYSGRSGRSTGGAE